MNQSSNTNANTNANTKPVNLDELLKKRFVVLDGKETEVLPVDGVGYQKLKEMNSGGGDAVLTMYEIAERCLPFVPSERVQAMSAAQVGAVVEVATAAVEMVEASAPKAKKPKGKGAPPAQ